MLTNVMTEKKTNGQGAHILVVEDEWLISEMVSEALTDNGFEVHVASNAKEALDYLESGQPVDVLFTDINLPGGMDGGSLARRARRLIPDLAVVYASAKASALRHLSKVPGSIFLPKPYDPSLACSLVAQVVRVRS